MREKYTNILLILGALLIISVFSLQLYWLHRWWDIKDNEFDITINIALRHVAEDIARYNNSSLPKKDLIQRRSSDIYAVNTNSKIDPVVLEDALYKHLNMSGLAIDFEYGVYDCDKNQLVYGYFCSISDRNAGVDPSKLPEFDDFIYYFVVKFPNRESYLFANLKNSILIAFLAIGMVLIFTWFFYITLRQKRLSALQRDFINNMTHEFKTPITSIQLAVNALEEQSAVQHNPKWNKYISIINNQNKRLNDQIGRILDIATIEGSAMKVTLSRVDLTQLITSIINEYALKYPNAQITISPTTALHFWVRADQLHLANVLYNLLDNALKYTNKPNPTIHFALVKTGQTLALSVSDDGIGMSPESLKHLFKKFYRVSTGDRHDIKGFGLGLYYVKEVCKAHGWKIRVESEAGKGSTFNITMIQTHE